MNSCSTNDTHRVPQGSVKRTRNLAVNNVILRKENTVLWSFHMDHIQSYVIQIIHNGQPNHEAIRKIFEGISSIYQLILLDEIALL